MNGYSGGSRIFSPGGAPTPKNAIIFQFFAENGMKMKEFGPRREGRVPGAPVRSANGLSTKLGLFLTYRGWENILPS